MGSCPSKEILVFLLMGFPKSFRHISKLALFYTLTIELLDKPCQWTLSMPLHLVTFSLLLCVTKTMQ